MNIVFFGTSEFAIPTLRSLLDSTHKILAVVTQPDRKKGRRLKLSPPPTKVLALAKLIPVHQPQDASGRESIGYLKGLDADLFVVVSFGQILKREVLSIPKFYSINLHGSLLPRYRGAAPTNWAIINGDEISGVTVIKMDERMDEGDIILKKEMKIDRDDTNITLSEKLSDLGVVTLLEAVKLVNAKSAAFTKQDNSQATYAPKLSKEDGLIDWKSDAVKIHNKVRGLLPWPGAYTHFEGRILKIWNTEISASSREGAKFGEVIDIVKGKGIAVHADGGDLIIKYLQLEGKKILDADSFLRGHKIAKGCLFS